MKHRFLTWAIQLVAILIAIGLIIFYARLTLPSLIIAASGSDPALITNILIVTAELVLITFIAWINYMFYKRLFITDRGIEKPILKAFYMFLVFITFLAILLLVFRYI